MENFFSKNSCQTSASSSDEFILLVPVASVISLLALVSFFGIAAISF